MPITPSKIPRTYVDVRDLAGVELEGRYRLKETLGEGGMGVVYRATQSSIGRDVAIKIIKLQDMEHLQRDGGVALERFEREIDIIAAMTHPNICRLLDSGRNKEWGIFYTVMEFIDGPNLSDMMWRKRARPEFALEVIYQLCGALSEPHEQGIIHRDLKPDNIMIRGMPDDTLQVKLVDFGIAKAVQVETTAITSTGMVVGTPQYMAPEQGRSDILDVRTDLYAVGAVLFEMLVGRPPFDAPTTMALLLKHIQEPPPKLVEVLDAFPYPGIATLVDDLLAKPLEDRPASAREVRRRIDDIRQTYGMRPPMIDASLPMDERFTPHMLTADDYDYMGETAVHMTPNIGPNTDERSFLNDVHPMVGNTQDITTPRFDVDERVQHAAGVTLRNDLETFEGPEVGESRPRSDITRLSIIAGLIFGLAILAGAAIVVVTSQPSTPDAEVTEGTPAHTIAPAEDPATPEPAPVEDDVEAEPDLPDPEPAEVAGDEPEDDVIFESPEDAVEDAPAEDRPKARKKPRRKRDRDDAKSAAPRDEPRDDPKAKGDDKKVDSKLKKGLDWL